MLTFTSKSLRRAAGLRAQARAIKRNCDQKALRCAIVMLQFGSDSAMKMYEEACQQVRDLEQLARTEGCMRADVARAMGYTVTEA